jgi:ABC-type transporter Mla MlaB component
VVFSLFGKKGEAPKKAEKKSVPTKTPVVAPTASPAKPASPEQGAVTSLDFSGYVPAPKSESPRPDPAPSLPAQGAPAATGLRAQAAAPSSSSSVLGDTGAKLPAAARSPALGSRASAGSAPAPSFKAKAADDVDPVVEETAILFANAQVEEALARLLSSVRGAGPGASMLQQWLMLFDLYQHLGKKVEFEALALEFVPKFERSAPSWLEIEPRDDPALATGGIGYCALSGTLSQASAPALEKLRRAVGTLRTIRIDCSKLEGLDGPGCRLLRETLLSIRQSGKGIMFTGEGQLIRLLEESCRPGRTQTDGAIWELLLEVCRMLDLKEKFEEAAVGYAVCFEVSPPSWELPAAAVPKRAQAPGPVETPEGAFVLSGEITGASETLAARLREWGTARNMLLIDMSQVRRVDFVTAGLMHKVFSKLQPAGIPVQIRGANELIHALFRVMGIDKVARIIPRR